MFAVVIMLIMAFAGYFFKVPGCPFIAFITGFIPGPKLELALQQMLVISDHGLWTLFMRSVSAMFMTLTIVVLARAVYNRYKKTWVKIVDARI